MNGPQVAPLVSGLLPIVEREFPFPVVVVVFVLAVRAPAEPGSEFRIRHFAGAEFLQKVSVSFH